MIELTDDQKRAIKSLQRLAKKWPDGLSLFSWSGSLCVTLNTPERPVPVVVAHVDGIPNDGGDPSDSDIDPYWYFSQEQSQEGE